MDFPSHPPQAAEMPFLPSGLSLPTWSGTALDYWLVELPDADDVIGYVPDMAGIVALGDRALIITALASPASGVDMVSRMFAPNVGIPEDPVTGSAHCVLAPYWAAKLKVRDLVGFQASARGGTVRMRLRGDRVTLSGQAVTVAEVHVLGDE